MSSLTLHLDDVHKHYHRGSETISVLRGVQLEVEEGEFLGIIGPSGSGKSTLLNLIAGLDRPTRGSVWIANTKVSSLSEAAASKWRTNHIGFIFQFYHLIPVLSAYENVELPLLLFPMTAAQRRRQVLTALDLVGLHKRMKHRPGQLSGGEQQRVGIARAIVTDPRLLVADEPTGDLDAVTSDEILNLLQGLQQGLNKTVVLVTHDPQAAARTSRLVRLNLGTLEDIPQSAISQLFPGWQHV